MRSKKFNIFLQCAHHCVITSYSITNSQCSKANSFWVITCNIGRKIIYHFIYLIGLSQNLLILKCISQFNAFVADSPGFIRITIDHNTSLFQKK